jgi:hypothetical protein
LQQQITIGTSGEGTTRVPANPARARLDPRMPPFAPVARTQEKTRARAVKDQREFRRTRRGLVSILEYRRSHLSPEPRKKPDHER